MCHVSLYLCMQAYYYYFLGPQYFPYITSKFICFIRFSSSNWNSCLFKASKGQLGRKRKQPGSSSGPANSSGTANTTGPMPSSPSTPSTHTPGDAISVPTLPHNSGSSKSLLMFGSDGLGSLASASNELVSNFFFLPVKFHLQCSQPCCFYLCIYFFFTLISLNFELFCLLRWNNHFLPVLQLCFNLDNLLRESDRA